MASKPTLHDIAAMPFPASVEAMRKHYNPAWGRPVDGDGSRRTYRVKLSGEVRTVKPIYETVEIAAFSEDEAIELAQAQIEQQHPDADEIDFYISSAEDIGEASNAAPGPMV